MRTAADRVACWDFRTAHLGMTGLASKALVWLAAALLPFEPLSAVSCCCAAPGQPPTAVELRRPPVGLEGGCCRRVKSCCPDGHSLGCCCAKSRSAATTSCCRGGNKCTCRSDDSSPPIPEVPPESASRPADDAAHPPLAVFLSPDQSQMPLGDLSVASPGGPSGSQCCVLFCRFNL
jgi:hypothetical protein